jgi:arylsulfatase A-like enzyme
MNFQAVSVGQKVTADGYADAAGTPSAELLASIDFVDLSLGKMLDALQKQKLLDSTLVIVGAKHGQSPIDVSKLHMLQGSKNPKVAPANKDVVDPADLLRNGGVPVAQETADDIALLWLKDQTRRKSALALLDADQATNNSTRIQKIYSVAMS